MKWIYLDIPAGNSVTPTQRTNKMVLTRLNNSGLLGSSLLGDLGLMAGPSISPIRNVL